MIVVVEKTKALNFLSRDHHHTLELCERIRIGLKNSIAPLRIREYCIHVFEGYLKTHFEIEEKYVFPVVGLDDKMVKKALADHRKIKRLMQCDKDVLKCINLIEEVLERHIRFEEQVLFPEFEKVASVDDFNKIVYAQTFYTAFKENDWSDKFW